MSDHEHTVGPDRALWLAKIRSIMLVRWKLPPDDRCWLERVECRLLIKGMRAVLTPEERERVERIERGVSNA